VKAAKQADAKAAKQAKASSKRQQEIDADNAKERLAEMEVDESFTQMEETQRRVHRQSDIEDAGGGDDEEALSGEDKGRSDAPDGEGPPDDEASPQLKSKVSVR
jgi:hypothetical protein